MHDGMCFKVDLLQPADPVGYEILFVFDFDNDESKDEFRSSNKIHFIKFLID